MKKILTTILLLCCIIITGGCRNTELDTSKYTASSPFITENIELSDEQAKTGLQGPGYHFGGYGILSPEDYPEALSAKVKKLGSKHYYWESGEEINYYTVTTLEILEIISGTEKHLDSYKKGSTIRVLEYYSFDPKGDFQSAITNYHPISLNQITGELIHLSMYVPYVPILDYSIHLTPFIKSDTEYIITLQDRFLIDSNNVNVKFLWKNSIIPNEHIDNTYFYKNLLVEISETEYNKAKAFFSEYDNPVTLNTPVPTDQYYKEVIYLWEKYGDRVKSGE